LVRKWHLADIQCPPVMSAFGGKTDITGRQSNV
jgi:hypothetical protein